MMDRGTGDVMMDRVTDDVMMDRVTQYMQNGQYAESLEHLFQHSVEARKALLQVLPGLVEKELCAVLKSPLLLEEMQTLTHDETERCDSELSKYDKICPILYSCLKAALLVKNRTSSQQPEHVPLNSIKPVLGVILSLVFCVLDPGNYNYTFAKLSALLPWLQSWKQKECSEIPTKDTPSAEDGQPSSPLDRPIKLETVSPSVHTPSDRDSTYSHQGSEAGSDDYMRFGQDPCIDDSEGVISKTHDSKLTTHHDVAETDSSEQFLIKASVSGRNGTTLAVKEEWVETDEGGAVNGEYVRAPRDDPVRSGGGEMDQGQSSVPGVQAMDQTGGEDITNSQASSTTSKQPSPGTDGSKLHVVQVPKVSRKRKYVQSILQGLGLKQRSKAVRRFRKRGTSKRGNILDCPVCEKSFSTSSSRTRHMLMHAGDKPHACGVCQKAFYSASDLNDHVRTHTGEKPHVCPECGKAFIRSSTLTTHRRIHGNDKPYVCQVCGRGFKQLNTLKYHVGTHKKDKDRTQTCHVCQATFRMVRDMVEHVQKHHGDINPFQCPECLKCFSSSGYLSTHLMIHRGEKPFICQVCTKGFNQATSLKRHQLVHTGEKMHVCHLCGHAYSDVKSLKSHLINHDTKKTFKCPICKVRLPSKAERQKHKLEVHANEKRHFCAECNKGFSTIYNLKIHMGIHQGKRPFPCTQCDKAFTQASALKRHTLTHSGIKRFICHLCGRGFNDTRSIQNHKCETRVAKSHDCRQCGKTLSTAVSLKRHERMHSGARHDCRQCEKMFSSEVSLKRHERTHTGPRPHCCMVCGKGYSQASLLEKHKCAKPKPKLKKLKKLQIKTKLKLEKDGETSLS